MATKFVGAEVDAQREEGVEYAVHYWSTDRSTCMPTAEPFSRYASWSCDNCGESFDDYHEAVEHEDECEDD